jgi:hypothetical protein
MMMMDDDDDDDDDDNDDDDDDDDPNRSMGGYMGAMFSGMSLAPSSASAESLAGAGGMESAPARSCSAVEVSPPIT